MKAEADRSWVTPWAVVIGEDLGQLIITDKVFIFTILDGIAKERTEQGYPNASLLSFF